MTVKYIQTIGRRKTAMAQVRLYPGGSGKITINNREFEDYIKLSQLRDIIVTPLRDVGKLNEVDITVRTVGGGQTGQSDAIKLGIARALVKWDESLKTVIKTHGFLTRDSRKKERKKFGKRGARRSPQWRKR